MTATTAPLDRPATSDAPAEAPQPVAPTGGLPVDGSAVTFSWTDVSDALDYRLHVAADAGFQQEACILETGPTTRLTLFEMLPQDGSVFHWRVQARTASGWLPWSRAERFQAGTEQHALRAQQKPSGQPGTKPKDDTLPEARPPEVAPYQVGRTGKATVVLVLAMMIATFAATAAYIAYVVSSAQ